MNFHIYYITNSQVWPCHAFQLDKSYLLYFTFVIVNCLLITLAWKWQHVLSFSTVFVIECGAVPPVKVVTNDYLILLIDNITEPSWGKWNIWRMVQVHRQIPSARASAHWTRCSTNSIHLLHLLHHAPISSIHLFTFSTFLLTQKKCLPAFSSAYRQVSHQNSSLFFYWGWSKIQDFYIYWVLFKVELNMHSGKLLQKLHTSVFRSQTVVWNLCI